MTSPMKSIILNSKAAASDVRKPQSSRLDAWETPFLFSSGTTSVASERAKRSSHRDISSEAAEEPTIFSKFRRLRDVVVAPESGRAIPGGVFIVPGRAKIVPGKTRIVPGRARIVPGSQLLFQRILSLF